MLVQAQVKEHLNLKDADIKRRFFIKNSIKLLPYFGAGAFIYPLAKFLSHEETKQISKAIPLSEIKSTITKIDKMLVHKQEEQITVFSAHCTHMGCVLNIDTARDRFVCPCHDSEFLYDGTRLKGPAKRNLDIISSHIKDKILYIG
jgi:cytochrome b6-f complex iron-sulfur subunit